MEFYSELVGWRVWLCDDCTSSIDQFEFIVVVTEDMQACGNVQ
jgi:hypothetical protein